MNKKWILPIVLGILLVVGVSAVLVDYLSNTVSGTVDVESPITIEVMGNSGGSFDGTTYTSSIYGGQSFSVDTETTVHVDGVTGHIAETKLVGFDGVGITVEYRDANWPGVFELQVCVDGGNAYFYIGDPTETLDAQTFGSTTTFTAALDLDPSESITIETKVILAENAACAYEDPIFIPNVV